jgi:hypothetical protein
VRTRLAAALAASVGLGIVSQGWGQEATTPNASGPTQEPNRLSIRNSVTPMSANQRIADAIADKLNHSPILSNFRVTVTVQDGDVELTGILWTDAQRAEVLRLTKSVAGVERVHDRMHVTVASNIVQTQASPPAAAPFQPIPLQGGQTPPPPALQFPPGLDVGRLPPGLQDPKKQPGVGPMPPLPPGFGPAPPPGGIFEPVPIQGSLPGFPSAQQPPPMPPYAWPTYAPYNNYARVAYPNLYPYESFPFIGPFYPFPRIPLGWRSVTLTWEDGSWWLGRNATGHDWWRVRYW